MTTDSTPQTNNASHVLFMDQGFGRSGFPRPECLEAQADPLKALCRPLKKLLLEHPEIESVNIDFARFPWAVEPDLMGWDLLAFTFDGRELCVALQDVNGDVAGYQAQLSLAWLDE